MTFGSLFSGIGGMDLGLERSGMKCVWQVEIDSYARRVLEKHWPGVPRWDDVRDFPAKERWCALCSVRYDRRYDNIEQCSKCNNPTEDISGINLYCDIIAGGFPCKQTSSAAAIHGMRTGVDGKDSRLWFEMLRVVSVFRPAWVIVENVSGAVKWSTTIKSGLENLGYRVPIRPLEMSASCLGAPHSRRRMFWIADFDGKGLEITRQGGPSKKETQTRRTFAGNIWAENIAGTWGMDDGFSNRVDRLKGLGNSVVPQVAEWIGRRIMEAAK